MAKGIKSALDAASKAAKKERKPLIYPPVPPKSKQEIQELADRMARQVEAAKTNQFIRLDPKSTNNPAGKSKKAFDREVRTPVLIERTEEEFVPPTVNISDLEGSVLIGVPGDPTLGGIKTLGDASEGREAFGFRSPATPTMYLRGVGDVEFERPVSLFGGPRYGEHLSDRFWASNLTAARAAQNQVDRLGEALGVPVYGEFIKMTPESGNFAVHSLDSVLQYVRPDQMPKGKRKELEKIIKAGTKQRGSFPEFVGFEDLEELLSQASGTMMASRKEKVPTNAPDLRKMIVDTLIKPTIAQKFGLRPGLDAFSGIQNPNIRNFETGTTGFSIGRMMPGEDLLISQHPTYSHDIPGTLVGQARYPTPVDISMPRSLEFARQNAKPGDNPFNTMKMSGAREVIDPQYVDQRLMYERMMRDLLGYKKGGKVKSPLSALSKVRKPKHG